MPTYRITAPDGKSYNVTAPEGASQDEVLAYAQRSYKMAAAPKQNTEKPFQLGEWLNGELPDAKTPARVARQVGLTGRYALEGVGDVLDTLASPIRAGLNAILPNKPQTMAGMITGQAQGPAIQGRSGETLANMLGLPTPQNSQERVVGDATRLLAGSAVPIAAGAGLARAAPLAGSTAGNVGAALASNRGQQLASAAAAGGAGGYTRETGGGDAAQTVAALAAGIGAPLAVSGAQRASTAAMRPRTAQPIQIDVRINNALQDSGIKLADLPADVAASVRRDVGAALQTGENLSQDAIRRLADYRLTGLTPTQARLTLDPADVTRQANLSKLGANSQDPAAQALARTARENNQALTQNLNALGASTADDPLAGAQRVMGALSARNDRAKQIIGQAYQGARDTQGRAAQLDPSAFTQSVGDKLNQANIESFLTPDLRRTINGIAQGEIPFTVDVAEQLKTTIGNIQRNSTDGNVRTALGLVRSALDDTPLLPGQQIGQESINAFNKARALNRSWMKIVERTPALQAVRDGIEPDKFVQQFIVGSGKGSSVIDVAQLKNSIKSNPDAMAAVKEQISAFLKSKALSGADDEIGNFSQSGYNKALKAIGDRKLALFFDKPEIDQLKAIGRVAGYEQFQPVGSAVNNSNTAGAMGGLLERIGGSQLLGRVPLGGLVRNEAQNILINQQSGQAMNVPRALLGGASQLPKLPSQPRGMVLSPAALMGMESEEERRRREAGLTIP
jgi:hypothetical protein